MTRRLRHLHSLRPCVVGMALAALLALPGLSGGAPASSEDIVAHFDAAEDAGNPLDLYGVRFGQTASTDVTLIVRTHKPWAASLLNPEFGRSLCVLLRSAEQAKPAGRLCAYPSQRAQSGLSLRYTVLNQDGSQRGIRDLSPTVTRPNKSTFRVTFQPSLLRLKPGLYHWWARSRFRDETGCPPPAGCEDRLPNTGEADLRVTLSVAPAARQRCFGAASRDPRKRCRNPRLARVVVPTPDDAVITPNLPCNPLKQDGLIIPCEFGVPKKEARTHVALMGDSHAAHWRAAIEVVSQKLKWRGVSITRSGCPYTRATVRLDPITRRNQCLRWNRQIPRWLARNREISTVFVVAHFDAGVVARGRNEFVAKMDGYSSAWKYLPKSVKRVIVIRDTPRSGTNTLGCISSAIARGRKAGIACAMQRDNALGRDPAAAAVAREGKRRFKAIDMTSFFCSRRMCFPVVGGALVYKDISHLTDVFASSLGPYLLRKVRALNSGR